jgi:hypothetical protein
MNARLARLHARHMNPRRARDKSVWALVHILLCLEH